jgi:hypothetical protein
MSNGKILETEHWCLMLPDEWWAEHDDDVVRIIDNDDVGEIEITTLLKESGPVSPQEITAMSTEESPEVADWKAAQLGAFAGVQGQFVDDEAFIREWYVANQNVLLYVTYICALDDGGMDDAAVDELLGTLVIGDAVQPL